MTILAVIVVLLVSVLNSSTTAWRRQTSKIQTFQEARAAYENITRKISQATLNTYWDYETNAAGDPVNYKRQSELAFTSGFQSDLIPSIVPSRTHSIFFQAPLGYTDNPSRANLRSLLNTSGFFVEFGDDASDRPAFLANGSIIPPRQRFRLKEVWQPSENLAVYNSTPPADWIPTSPSSTLAENIIALIILPKLPEREDPEGDDLAPEFSYDSTDDNAPTTLNQLPPLVQVVMVAIDEASAARFEKGNSPPTYGVKWNDLFQKPGSPNPDQLELDIAELEKQLVAEGVNFQIFNSTIPIEGAKWSR